MVQSERTASVQVAQDGVFLEIPQAYYHHKILPITSQKILAKVNMLRRMECWSSLTNLERVVIAN
jgi:hypothetical protein